MTMTVCPQAIANLARRMSSERTGSARNVAMEACSSESAVIPGFKPASTATNPIWTIASCTVKGKRGVCTRWPTSRYATNPSDVMCVNHNWGVRTKVRASLRNNATHGRAGCTNRERTMGVRGATVVDSLQPCTNVLEIKASAAGQSTSVAKSKNENHTIASSGLGIAKDDTRSPAQVLGSQTGALGSCSVEISPLARAMPEKLATQNAVGTTAPMSHSDSFACCAGM